MPSRSALGAALLTAEERSHCILKVAAVFLRETAADRNAQKRFELGWSGRIRD